MYEALELTPSASEEEIKKQYRRLALRYHPDKVSPSVDSTVAMQAERRFKEINEAYAVLSDEKKRRKYDIHGDENEGFSAGPQVLCAVWVL